MEAGNLATIIYGVFCFLAAICAVGVIAFRNPVTSAFCLVLTFCNLAAVFAMQEAHFVAIIQILVYAGAIMVLFVFVVMLLNVDHVKFDYPDAKSRIFIGIFLPVLFFISVLAIVFTGYTAATKGIFTTQAIAQNGGNIRVLSEVMFSNYIYAFEITAVLLLLAIVGAIVLAKRKVE